MQAERRQPASHTQKSHFLRFGMAVSGLCLIAFTGRASELLENRVDAYGGATQSQGDRVNVSGRAIDSSSGLGIGEANVVVSSPGKPSHVVTTDLSGRFAVQLVRGTYQITVTHPNYGAGGYGQMWPGGPPRPLHLDDAVQNHTLTIRLWRYAAVGGAVRTTDGVPLAGVTVQLISRSIASPAIAKPLAVVTDRDGSYQFTQVPPGKYIVGTIQSYQTACEPGGSIATCSLRAREKTLTPVSTTQETKVYETTFYADAHNADDAEIVWLHPGEIRVGVDFSVPLVKGLRVSGTVRTTDNPLANLFVRATRIGNASLGFNVSMGEFTAITSIDGHFYLLGLPTGNYEIHAEYRPVEQQESIVIGQTGPVISGRVRSRQLSDADPILEATVQTSIVDVDVQLELLLQRAPFLKGTIRFEDGTNPPNLEQLPPSSIVARPVEQNLVLTGARIATNGEFYFPSLPAAQYTLSIDSFPGWRLASITVRGLDLGDRPIDLRYQSADGIVVHLRRSPSFTGFVVDANGRKEPNASVIIFPDKTSERSARAAMLLTNVSEQGEFKAGPLNSGVYRIVAVTDAWFDLDWREPEILQRLSTVRTETVSIRENESRKITIRSSTVP